MCADIVAKNFATKAAFNRARFKAIDRGVILQPWCLKPCRVKILIVVDGFPGDFLNITFGELYFSLSAVLDTLANNPEPWLKFDVTKAHRQTDPLGEADLEGFRFTQAGFDINAYDQVWLFGARSNENDPLRLSDQELAVLARWMDEKRGGVFATGDHANLGASLCARVPRVKSMRKWTAAQNVPQPTGLNRHDTLRKGHNAFYTFNDESDDQPMPTEVTMFPVRSWSPFLNVTGPHPVLCGTCGIINILPDHPHEGEVIEPASLSGTFSFPGYTNKPEFPEITGMPGVREKPHVIARANVLGDHTEGRNGAAGTDRNKGPANAKKFGVVGAYNGHVAAVGRVVVDSTWHHWFDVNLTGRPPEADDPIDSVDLSDPDEAPKDVGFLHTPIGKVAYARIQNYFRNVAIWLAPPAKQDCMFFRASWWIVNRYPLVEQLHPKLPIWELGGYALDVFGRHAGQCTVRHWIFDRLDRQWLERLVFPPPEPCLTCPPIQALEQLVMGGIVREMLEVSYAARDKATGPGEEAFARAMSAGLETGAKAFIDMTTESLRSTASFMEKLKTNDIFAVKRGFLAGGGSPRTRAKKTAKSKAKKVAKKTTRTSSKRKRR